MNKIKSTLKHFQLTFIFAMIVFVIMFFTMFLLFSLTHLLAHFNVIENVDVKRFPLFLFSLISVLVGTILSIFFSKLPLRPIREIMKAVDQIAGGDYSIRLDLKGPEDFRKLSDKFNHMAEELGSVEMLRTDFVNNFSHEFKTPIVSIRGFAKALKWDDLSDEERNEYLNIIIHESKRLSDLSANVLYLSKLEKQTILTGQKTFNISEQIRLAIALLDEKLIQKHLDIIFDSNEFFITGNEEMLKQVWINLLDNAIKFSPVYGKVKINIIKNGEQLIIGFTNDGEHIPPEIQEHIFDKFYQGDCSHSTPGNGLGLSIAKKIVTLHSGSISVHSADKENTFTICLPC